ncbi:MULTISPECIES: chorismate mutase [Streptomyces]|uniref:chorismate mutase n=1 Tax=Streptomyces TaxID=1883 RepID=UPI002119D53E|nr:chorismate mutase [Streptomyces hilarionis]MCQ9131384.1 chorismate mutase [Streptomyces hilarionis]
MSAALDLPASMTKAPQAVPANAAEREVRALLADLDGQIITMVLRRAELARYDQSTRRLSGLPASELAWENAVLGRYADALGRAGVDIGRALLALSRLPPAYASAGRGAPQQE